MRNDRNQWNDRSHNYRQDLDDDYNSEWRPTNYRSWNDDSYNEQARGYRQYTGADPDYNPYRSRYGAGSAYNRQGSNQGSYGSNRGYGNSNRHYRQSNYNQSYDASNQGASYSRSNRFGNAYNENRYGHSGVGYNRNYHQDSDYERRTDYRRNENVSDQDDRDFWDKAGDEIASWFGDDEARRRREMDQHEGHHNQYYTGASYRGKGPKNYKRTDARIEEDVNDRLSDDPHIDASDIDVSVSNGEVILSGTVSNRFAKRHAEDLAEMISGVSNVENRIRVKTQDSGLSGTTATTITTSQTDTTDI